MNFVNQITLHILPILTLFVLLDPLQSLCAFATLRLCVELSLKIRQID